MDEAFVFSSAVYKSTAIIVSSLFFLVSILGNLTTASPAHPTGE
jgi:hypothetical protein